MAAACGLSDVFSSPGLEAVVITYQGPAVLTAGTTVPFSITVAVNGTPLSNPRLQITLSNPTTVALTAGQDSLVALSQGKDTLTVRLQSSILTDSAPTIIQPLRIQP
jgi:hypothetical protein